VLLDVHWLSDVVAGVALGWAWFAVCAIAFGGRLLRFGAGAEQAAAEEAAEQAAAGQPAGEAAGQPGQADGQGGRLGPGAPLR
jgi:hypothetical protein